MNSSKYLKGLCLKVGPLGENDRLLTILSDEEGVTRLAVPGARRPTKRSSHYDDREAQQFGERFRGFRTRGFQ